MKKALVIILTVCILFSSGIPDTAFAASFTDVSTTDWFYEPVNWAVKEGITAGTGPATFTPERTCTIAEIMTFLWRACGSPSVSTTESPYSNLSPSDYYYTAALWCSENGMSIWRGDGTSKEYPASSVCERFLVVYFLYSLRGFPDTDPYEFNDIGELSEYEKKAISWAVHHGITTGTGDGSFSPNAPCSRSQIVTLLYRAANAGQLVSDRQEKLQKISTLATPKLNENYGPLTLYQTSGKKVTKQAQLDILEFPRIEATSIDYYMVYYHVRSVASDDFSIYVHFLDKAGNDLEDNIISLAKSEDAVDKEGYFFISMEVLEKAESIKFTNYSGEESVAGIQDPLSSNFKAESIVAPKLNYNYGPLTLYQQFSDKVTKQAQLDTLEFTKAEELSIDSFKIYYHLHGSSKDLFNFYVHFYDQAGNDLEKKLISIGGNANMAVDQENSFYVSTDVLEKAVSVRFFSMYDNESVAGIQDLLNSSGSSTSSGSSKSSSNSTSSDSSKSSGSTSGSSSGSSSGSTSSRSSVEEGRPCPYCDAGSCRTCNGSGVIDCDKCFMGRCDKCSGSGYTVKKVYDKKLKMYSTEHVDCTTCHGSGDCTKCNGKSEFTCTKCNYGSCRYCNGTGWLNY